MNIIKLMENETLKLTLEGRLDTTTALQLQEVLIPAFNDTKSINLDFEKLVYVSSAGLRVLLMGQKTAKSVGGSMVLTNVSTDIMEVFEMTGFADMLTIK